MKRAYGLSPTNKKRFVQKSNSLKLKGFPPSISKKGTQLTRKNSATSKFDKKQTIKIKNNPNLEKANNKILNFITNCVEKIKDEKNDDAKITSHLEGILEKNKFLKELKKGKKKEVHINPINLKNNNETNYQRVGSKKSVKSNKKFLSSKNQIFIKKNSMNSNFNKSISESGEMVNGDKIRKKRSKPFKRIRTTKLAKEKEKEIVYNISSSLISLYKPFKKQIKSKFSNFRNNINNNTIIPKEQEKPKIKLEKKKSFSTIHLKIKKKINKRNSGYSNDERYHSNFSTDTQTVKKPTNLKKFKTFIKTNNHRYKIFKNPRFSSKFNRNAFEDLLYNTKNSSIKLNKLTKNISQLEDEEKEPKEEKKKNNKNEKFNVLKWTNELKNKENLTQGEYAHIEQDLIQSLIGYEKTKLEEDLKIIESTETTELINKLPTLKKKQSNINNNNSNSFFKDKFDETLMNVNIVDLNLKDNIKYDKEKFRFLQHTGYVYDSLDDEEIEDAIDINYYYIRPDSIFIYIFDTIIAILSFYCLYYYPYYLAHDSFLVSSILNFKIFIFHIIDFFCIIDLLISFFRSFFNYDEILVKNIPEMCWHYIKNWFLVDFLAAIPFFSIFFFLEHKNINTKHLKKNLIELHIFTHYGVKLDKMHYLLFLNKLLKVFKCFSDNNRALNKIIHILFQNNIIEEKSGIFFVIFILLVSIHFGTCIFIFIGRNSYPSWINSLGLENNTFTNIYICSLYYLITTITTVGYGDIYGRTIKEILFQIILLIIGTCTYSYLISSVSNFIKKINEKSLIFENKLKILNEIKLTNPYMQESLYEKILRFLRYKKNTEKNKQTYIINSLPYSLRNSLLIEMYKPIINNFIIFKGLENSNCIIQLVTAFKPIYAIKNDILIQEGDFIEEVIFIKAGVISLEIGIDFNKIKESIVQYLDRIENKDKGSSSIDLYTKQFDTNINNMSNNNASFFQNYKTTLKSEKKEKNIHFLKVLDIRKNEHFGETLMFLNERSFLYAKDRSKKAELFFLKKEEVIKVFNNFPNIWNRINKKSIYNMNQIKITVKKVLMNFCSMVGINIGNENENDNKRKPASILKNSNKRKIKNISKENNVQKDKESENKKEENRKLINNDNSNSKNLKEKSIIEEEKKEEIEKVHSSEDNQKKTIISKKDSGLIILDKPDDNSLSSNLKIHPLKSNTLSPQKKNNNTFKYSYNNASNNLSNNSKINVNVNHSVLKSLKNNSNKNSSFRKDISNKEEENENDDNSSKMTIKIPINRNPCTLIDSDSINDDGSLSNLTYEVNNEIYKNEIFNLDCDFKNDLLGKNCIIKSYLNNNISMENLSKKILENTWIKNLNKEKVAYLEKVINKSPDNFSLNKLNVDNSPKIKNKNKICFQSSSSSSSSSSKHTKNLRETEVESFQIKASYENINKITCYKYIKNIHLRNKTKDFLLKEIVLNENKINESRISSDLIFNNKNTIYENKYNLKNKSKIKKEKDKNKSVIVTGRKRANSKKINKRVTMPNFKRLTKRSTSSRINILRKKSGIKEQYLNASTTNFIPSKTNNYNKNSPRSLIRYPQKSQKNNSPKANKNEFLNKSAILYDKEISFYEKCNTNKNLFKNEFIERKKTIKKKKKQESAELEEMQHIIKKDAQNLTNPSLYYQQLFLHQIQKRRKLPNSNQKTFFHIKKNKNENNLNINLSIKRTSTDLKTINNRFGVSPQKINKRSSIVFSSKIKKIKI